MGSLEGARGKAGLYPGSRGLFCNPKPKLEISLLSSEEGCPGPFCFATSAKAGGGTRSAWSSGTETAFSPSL